jgi:hypothetical protein
MNYAKVGFWLGVTFSLITIGFNIYLVTLVKDLRTEIRESKSVIVDYPTERLNDMLRTVKSMENFLKTTPLVECGDYKRGNNGDRKDR